ncbi:MAG: beta-galactosidase [Bacteroidetes bacterium]|nr:beta-galactosidase [Bacteroidota bacterium]
MRSLLGGEYIPFGTQYYRAPSPAPSEWERDLATIARLGLNTVKFWIQWRWNTPGEDEYEFSDIDRLMGIADRNGLRVMLNTIVDVAPVWIYRKYPDASMVTLDGRRIGPQVQPHRQIGGLGLCFNHEPAVGHMMDFLRTSFRRYADHPALAMWNVGSEPELTSSMAELRLYAENAERMGDMLCYCHRCAAAFKVWLSKKYATVDALNRSWNRRYKDFDEVELPLTRNSFNDMIDWRMFFVHTLGENVRQRFAAAQEIDKGKHPLLCHHVFVQGFPVTSTASDPWNVGRFGDLHGITQMDDPMMCDVVRSCAQGRPVISAEMLMQYGYTLDLPHAATFDDVKRFVFTGVGANLKGFIFWQYRPETLAREAPAWGLTHLDGSETPMLKGFCEVNKVLQRNAGFLLDASPRPAEVALLYHPENQIFGWIATGNEKFVTDSLMGAHSAWYTDNFGVDFLHPGEISAGLLKRYKVIALPFPYVLGASLCVTLSDWVAEGGVLIAEAYCGGWDMENGRHHITIPGYGLHSVFKVRQHTALPPDHHGRVEIALTSDLPGLPRGTTLTGSLVRESYILEGAEAIAAYPDGAPAITHAEHGKGHAFAIGSYIARPVFRDKHTANAALLAALAGWKTSISRPRVTGDGKVRVDILTDARGAAMIIIRNLEVAAVRAQTTLPGLRPGRMTEQFSGATVEATHAGGETVMPLNLAPGEVQVFCG